MHALAKLCLPTLIGISAVLGAMHSPLSPGVEGIALAQPNKPSRPPHRILRQGMFDLTLMDSISVVMLGDSLTEQAQWAEITGCPFAVNRGIGGDDSAGVLRRLSTVTRLKPSAVFLMIGVNDVNSDVPTETIASNVRSAVVALEQGGAHVYLILVLPVAESFAHNINSKVDDLNAAYQKLAEETGATVIDFRKDMRTDSGYLRNEFSLDGIHLTPAGFRVWRDAIRPYVVKHCRGSGAVQGTPSHAESH